MSNSYAPPNLNTVRSPQQAANTFSQVGGLARQRNVFLVRFISNVRGDFSNLTFAAKSFDRPRVNATTEELNQYNKRRQIYTGYKLEPVNIQFYDSADGAAQNMWATYSGYYFGDLNPQTTMGNTNASYNYDVTMNTFNDFTNSGFGFTAANGGSTDINAQFFFDRIEIYQFYDGLFDLYYLVHPKITAFSPNGLDYQDSEVSVIDSIISYENLQYFLQQPVTDTPFDEFTTEQFNGNPLILPDVPFPPAATAGTPNFYNIFPSNPSVSSLLSIGLTGTVSNILDYRFFDPSGGAIGGFGNFVFGPSSAQYGQGNTLSTMSLGNPALTAALNAGSSITNKTDILAGNTPILAGSNSSFTRGIDGAKFDVLNAKAQIATTGYGTNSATVASGMLAANALNGSSANVDSSGQIVLSPEAYGSINAQQTGTAQFGFDVQTNIEGQSWGFTGPNGFNGPNAGPQNFGPYNNNQPAGLDGRFVAPPSPIPPTFGD